MTALLPHIWLIAIAYLAAGTVKGVIGMGLPTVAIAVLAVIITPAQAAALLIAPSLVTNTWQMLAGPYLFALLRRLGGMVIGLFVGAWLGAGMLTGSSAHQASLWLGIALAVYAAFGLSKIRFSVPRGTEIWIAPLVGIATGIITAATGVFALPALPYLQAIGLERDEMIQALGLHFTMSTLALAAVLYHGGAFDASLGIASLLAVVPALAGMLIGQSIRKRLPLEAFRICFYVGLFLLGANLVWGNWSH